MLFRSRFEPTIAAIPAEFADRLEPAEMYHQVLEHRWFLSEAMGGDIGLHLATQAYVRDVLPNAPDEQRATDRTEEIGIITTTSMWDDEPTA